MQNMGSYKMYHGPDGHAYYCNTLSGEVTWTLPEGATLEGEGNADASHDSVVNPMAGYANELSFTAHVGDDGYEYYCNTATGEVSWTLPEGARIVEGADYEQSVEL